MAMVWALSWLALIIMEWIRPAKVSNAVYLFLIGRFGSYYFIMLDK